MDDVTDDQGETPAEPLLRVVKGDPTPEELGALVAVVAALGGPAAPATRRTPVWNAPVRMQRRDLRQGPGAWRSSGLPSA
jgi:Acyl-CoA carboxylase epsilon subunit